jgi:hypothetical protein
MLVASLLLTLSPVAAEPSDPRAILDAFRAACQHADDLDRMRADARLQGWEEIPEGFDPRIERLARTGREMVGADWRLSGSFFRRSVGSASLFLIASRAEDRDGTWGSGCRVYDFEATERFVPTLLADWMGRPPTEEEEVPQLGSKLLWEPGWRDGVTVEVNHVPQDSPSRETYGLSGNIMVARAIGGF